MKTDSAQQNEIIEVNTQIKGTGARWNPTVREETLLLFEHLKLPPASYSNLQQEAVSVLSRCVPPTASNAQETGLVIGYVQSGKTMSFTTVAALARDNGYRMIIVLSGLTRNLFAQSRDRLEADLRTKQDRRRWLSIANPQARPEIQQSIMAALETNGLVQGPRTVLLTVMKNAKYLDQLITLLSRLKMNGVPALIIDDEADQASLNNSVRSGGESATYCRVVAIRQALPHHTYLQYTATPQAPLLINLIDILSPCFAEVLTPGSAYTGGRTFFESDFDLIRHIHEREIPSKNNQLPDPPDSLLEALQVFFVGVAAGRLEGADLEDANRSMMIHPSMKRSPHANFYGWVREIQKTWVRLLAVGEQNPDDPDYLDLLHDFRKAHADLNRTVNDLHSFDHLLPHLRAAISQTIPIEVNSRRGQTPEVDWRQQYAHILIGGEVLNRGYTVEGLTVSYMPRGKGTGQADTIQQRARWFGYKEDYLGYCRVYLADQTLKAYKNYVTHEENMRVQLRDFGTTERPLQEWKRVFFLSPDLKPTRHMALDLDYVRGNYSDSWYESTAPHDSEDAVLANRQLVESLVARYHHHFQPDIGHPKRTVDQIHLVASNISLQRVYEDFLTKLRLTRPSDSARFTGLLLQIGKHLENHQGDLCTIYQMRSGQTRERRLNDDKDEIVNLFQGRYPNDARSPSEWIYPGDREIRETGRLTIQIHRLRLTREGYVADDVPAIAVWVPKRLSAHWVSQHQG